MFVVFCSLLPIHLEAGEKAAGQAQHGNTVSRLQALQINLELIIS
jgi:hypothetical protein